MKRQRMLGKNASAQRGNIVSGVGRGRRGEGQPADKQMNTPLISYDADAFEIDYIHLGQRLREERMRMHKTQEEIAEAIGITPAFVGHLERGERSLSLDKLIRLCRLYGVTIDYLLSDTLPLEYDTIGSQIDALLRDKTDRQKTAFMDIMKAVIRNL